MALSVWWLAAVAVLVSGDGRCRTGLVRPMSEGSLPLEPPPSKDCPDTIPEGDRCCYRLQYPQMVSYGCYQDSDCGRVFALDDYQEDGLCFPVNTESKTDDGKKRINCVCRPEEKNDCNARFAIGLGGGDVEEEETSAAAALLPLLPLLSVALAA